MTETLFAPLALPAGRLGERTCASPSRAARSQRWRRARRRAKATAGCRLRAGAGDAEPAQPRLPARHGGNDRAARTGARQLLDLARADVPLPRPADARGRRGDRGARSTWRCWRRATPRSASSITCTTSRAARPMTTGPRCRHRIVAAAAATGHRAHAPAGALQLRRRGRRAARGRAAAVRQRRRRLPGAARRPARRRGLPARHAARAWRRIRCGRRRRRNWRGAGRGVAGCADPHPRRRAAAGGRRQVVAWLGARPVEWLLDNASASTPRWCLDPRHADDRGARPRRWRAPARSRGFARSPRRTSATASFDGRAVSRARAGAFGVGSDSNVRISLASELGALEYSQRLRDRARNVMAAPGARSGRRCYPRRSRGGAQALGRDLRGDRGGAARGPRGDRRGRGRRSAALGATAAPRRLVFAADDGVVRDVWSAGRHVVRDGRHVARDAVEAGYRAAMQGILRRIRGAVLALVIPARSGL